MKHYEFEDFFQTNQLFLSSFIKIFPVPDNVSLDVHKQYLNQLSNLYSQTLDYFSKCELFGYKTEKNANAKVSSHLLVFHQDKFIQSHCNNSDLDISKKLADQILNDILQFKNLAASWPKVVTISLENKNYIGILYKNYDNNNCYFQLFRTIDSPSFGNSQKEDINLTMKAKKYKALCKDYIEVEKPVTIKEFIIPYRISYSTFYKNFKTIFGITFNEYCQELKMAKLLHLLMFSNNTLSEIAFKMKFRNYSSLYKFTQKNFKQLEIKSIERFGLM